MNVVCNERKGNMRTLEQKVDILVRYCAAETEQARQLYYADLQSILTAGERPDARYSIERALADLGIPEHLLGYAYLRTAIELVARQPEAVYGITCWVYPAVAHSFSTRPPLVERAIRHAVERGWNRCDENTRAMYFGPNLPPDCRKPTNAEFIARIASVVRG